MVIDFGSRARAIPGIPAWRERYPADEEDARRERPADVPEGSSEAEELEKCATSFGYFLQYWRYEDRETGAIRSFRNLWPGQQELVETMQHVRQIYLLKAGKLGFTELECAYDGWVLRFKQQNARVHVFSMNEDEAILLAKIVRFGMEHMPDWMRLPVATGTAGGDTQKQVMWVAGKDDNRNLRAYPSSPNASIANSCTHAHVDEMARMPWPEQTYSAALSTVPAHGSMHIVTRGAGQGSYSDELWQKAQATESTLKPIFIDYEGRPRIPQKEMPDATQQQRNRQWYEEQRTVFTSTQQLNMFAPRTAEEALAPDAEESYIPIEHWDACYVDDLPELLPGSTEVCVLSLDAGISNDYFAATLHTRDPREGKREQASLRRFRVWRPQDDSAGVVDFDAVETWIKMVCLGGCTNGHPNKRPGALSDEPDCDACASGSRIQKFNVRHLCYDPYQLHDMMQRLARQSVTWVKAFDQGSERLEGDTDFRQRVMRGDYSHSDNPDNNSEMRQSIMNAKIKIPKGEDTKGRMEKRSAKAKIDLAVSAAMGAKRTLWLRI